MKLPRLPIPVVVASGFAAVAGASLLVVYLVRDVPTEKTAASGLVFDPNGPFGLARDFLVNLIAGEVAFAIEVGLILIFLPSLARWLENRKWKGVRRLLAERLFSQNEQLNS